MSIFQNSKFVGIFYALLGFSAFAFGDVIIKYLGQTYAPFTIAFFISLFVTIFLVLTAPKLGGLKQTFASKHLKLHFVRGLVYAAEFVLIIYGVSHLPLTTAYALIFIAPFIATIISIPMLGEHATRKQWLLIALGFIGVLVILRPGMVPLSLPSLAILGGAVGFALANVMVRLMDEKTETILSLGLLPEIVILGVTFLFFMFNPEIPTLPHLGLLAINGFFSGSAIILVSLAFAKAPAAIVSPFHYSQMLWGIVFGYFIFGDVLDIYTGIGAAIIIASGLLLIKRQKEKAGL